MKDRMNILTPVHDSDLPDWRNAKALYENTSMGRLMDVSRFGRDPLEDFQELNKEDKQNFLIISLYPTYLTNA